jgi:hypothetical protein
VQCSAVPFSNNTTYVHRMMPFLKHSVSLKKLVCIARAGAAVTGCGPRFFATNTGAKSASKQTRRRKSLAVSNTAATTITTKDRLRTVIDQSKVKASLLPTRDQASDVLNLAQSRVTWVRDKVYEFWGASTGDANGGSSSAAAASAVPNRPIKKDINMDVRWWLWNILFALVPALAIGIYCEFRGQKLMHEYYTSLETEQMRRILGEDAVLDEWVVLPPENFVVRIVRFGREITAMLLSSMRGDDTSKPQHRVNDNTEQLAIEQPTTRTPTTDKKTADDSVVVPTRQDAPIPAPTSSAAESAPSYKDDLVVRIEHLEALLLKQERERQRQIKYQLERLQQSGTQNRMEDDLIQKWKQKPGTPVSEQDAQQSAVTARKEVQEQQPLPTGSTDAGDDDMDNEAFGWSSLSKVKEVAEATLRKAADHIMPLLRETGRNDEQDTQEPTQDPAVDKASSAFLNVHPNELSIRGQIDNDTSASGHVHLVPQDVVARPGSSDTDESGTDRKRNKWWKLW